MVKYISNFNVEIKKNESVANLYIYKEQVMNMNDFDSNSFTGEIRNQKN